MTKRMIVLMMAAITSLGWGISFAGDGDVVAASPRMTDSGLPRGPWAGTLWELSSFYYQGQGDMKFDFRDDGTWTGEFGRGEKARRAAGTVTRRGRSVIVSGRVAGTAKELPMDLRLTLQPHGDRLSGVTETAFAQRSATAMVELHPAADAPAPPRGNQ
ncbi:MAG TPA: hypothetical protein VGU22_05035 [Methylomirabilota bacterium]|nr:hypothetical protein [Methylomirabilota bacterium]